MEENPEDIGLETLSPQNIVEGFFYAIDWKEPFILYILGFHVACLTLVILLRKQTTALFILWLFMLSLVVMAEHINHYCAENWKSFATQNYFDSKGAFISILFGLPLITNSFVVGCIWLIQLSRMMVVVKRAQIREQLRQKKKQQ